MPITQGLAHNYGQPIRKRDYEFDESKPAQDTLRGDRRVVCVMILLKSANRAFAGRTGVRCSQCGPAASSTTSTTDGRSRAPVCQRMGQDIKTSRWSCTRCRVCQTLPVIRQLLGETWSPHITIALALFALCSLLYALFLPRETI